MNWKNLLMLIVIASVMLVGCKNIEKLGPGNEMALENQGNLEKNTMRAFNNLKKVMQAYLKEKGKEWSDEDEADWKKQRDETAEQLVINYAWLLTLKGAIEANNIDPAFFGRLLGELPGWIKTGKDVADLIKGLRKED